MKFGLTQERERELKHCYGKRERELKYCYGMESNILGFRVRVRVWLGLELSCDLFVSATGEVRPYSGEREIVKTLLL